MWLGPPSMNSHTTRLARGAKCGGLAASGLDAGSSGSLAVAARPISPARARAPIPPPARARNSRRDAGTSSEQGRTAERAIDIKISIHEHEFRGIHQGVAQIDVGSGFVRLEAARTGLRLRRRGNVCFAGVDLIGLGR